MSEGAADSWGKYNGRIYWLQCGSCGTRAPDGAVGKLDCDWRCKGQSVHIHSREADPKCTPQGSQE